MEKMTLQSLTLKKSKYLICARNLMMILTKMLKWTKHRNPRVHQNTCLMKDQINTSTRALSESKLDNNVDEFRVRYPVEPHKENVQEAKTESNREYTSVFSLGSKYFDISLYG